MKNYSAFSFCSHCWRWPMASRRERTITPKSMYGTFPNSQVIPIAACDWAQPGDEYKIWLYTTNSAAIVDGHPAHTWWDGWVVQ